MIYTTPGRSELGVGGDLEDMSGLGVGGGGNGVGEKESKI